MALRPGLRPRVTLALVLLLSATSPVLAQEVEQREFALERFRLASDGNGLLGVDWGDVGGHLSWNVGLWLGLADDPLVVYEREMDGDRPRRGSLVERRFAGALQGAITLLDFLQVGIQIPLVFSQQRDDDVLFPAARDLDSFALGDIRLAPKLQALRTDRHGLDLAIVLAFTVPSSSSDDYLGDLDPTFAPEVVVSRAFGPVRLAGNLGYRVRPELMVLDLEVDDELFAHMGVGYRFVEAGGPALELDATLAIATAVDDVFGAFNRNYVETLVGGAFDLPSDMQVFAGGGVGLNRGFGTPDWRVVAGVRYGKREGRDRDGDGYPDATDGCPDDPEDFDEFEDENGCPDPDNDQDLVLDVNDGAPLLPEDRDGFEDEDGVPDRDNDADGIEDTFDSCPNDPETKNEYEDLDGCPDEIPDTDGDGLNDREDECPTEPEDVDQFQDEDGCPDVDNDGDTVLDVDDRCVNEPGPPPNRGCPDTDRDGDTVVDRLDNCPDEAGPPANQGCPKKQLVIIRDDRFEALERVFFRTAKADIRRRSYRLLNNIAAVLQSHPDVRIRVEGHTDDRGDDDYNQQLSTDRANAVRDYLVAQGVDATRVEAVGYGETRPIDTNDTKRGRAANRRVEFVIIGWSDRVEPATNLPTGDTIDE